MRRRLIVNLGNSRMDWRDSESAGIVLHAGELERAFMSAFANRPQPEEVVVGSVARREITEALREWCRTNWDVAVRELVATAEAGGVRNAYAEPARLGIDRWAALVAARHIYRGDVLIADCGTAITVDYLARDGRHLGGLIAPGLYMMRESLVRGTRLELAQEPVAPPALLASDTESAVSAGTLGMIVIWLIRLAADLAASHGPPRAMLITGGDAPLVLEHLGEPWQLAPGLVLDGLERLAEWDS
ncbi:MAG: type III pantothenate kinase [Gammaproteobacteria bacterium]